MLEHNVTQLSPAPAAASLPRRRSSPDTAMSAVVASIAGDGDASGSIVVSGDADLAETDVSLSRYSDAS